MIPGNTKPDKLKGMKIPMPTESGIRHAMFSHYDVMEAMKKAIHNAGYEVGKVKVGVSASNRDAVICVEAVNETSEPKSASWLGVINCNSRKMKSTFYGGIEVAGHGVVMAKYQDWKHQDTTDLLKEATDAVDELSLDTLKSFGKKLAALKRKEVSKKELDDLMLVLARQHLLPWNKIRFVDISTRKEEKFTALELLHLFWDATKESEPVRMFVPRMDSLKRLWSFFRALTAKEAAFR